MVDINDPRLEDRHRKELQEGSGISDAVISARDYRTVKFSTELEALNFAREQCRAPGLLFPLHTVDGRNGLHVYKPDNPRVVDQKKKGKLADGTWPQKVIKYEYPKKTSMRVDCPPMCREDLGDPNMPLFITEGIKKADCISTKGGCAIALMGVWNWRGTNEKGGKTVLADFEYIAWNGRDVHIVYDSDAQTNPHIGNARDRLGQLLRDKGAHVHYVFLPSTQDGNKQGVDDWFVGNPEKTIEDLVALAEGPRPAVKAASPTVELLDSAPATLSRPLALINGRAYAATWIWVKVTVSQSLNKKGEVVRHDPPIVKHEERLFVVDDDGVIYGDGGDYPLEELKLVVKLPEKVTEAKRLSKQGLMKYREGQLPDPVTVFQGMCECIDRFIDFDRSLGTQEFMVEMVACYAMSTWFLDAFTVAGFLWPNGDRGSGKTQLLIVITELAYLGQVILAGGSFAALRDLADYGATLAFDDAENLTDPRKTDPDKRTLLLAGNRRGNTVPLKEKDGDNGWRTRYVNTFSCRLFSAIQLPDNVLSSRTIIVPLIRTPDRYRANADPLDKSLWPHDRNQLQDELYCLGLMYLPKMSAYEATVNQKARLTGRNLEPWRALLAVARWLDDQGVNGLWERMEQLSLDYQQERPNMEVSDLTSLAIRAVCQVVGEAIRTEREVSDVNEVSDVFREKHFCLTAKFTDAAQAILEELELDINADHVTSRRLGRTLGKMRLLKGRQPGTGKHGWQVSLADMGRWCVSYGLDLAVLSRLTIVPPKGEFTNSTNITKFTVDDSELTQGVI